MAASGWTHAGHLQEGPKDQIRILVWILVLGLGHLPGKGHQFLPIPHQLFDLTLILRVHHSHFIDAVTGAQEGRTQGYLGGPVG